MPAAPSPKEKSDVTAERPSLLTRVAAVPVRALSGLRHNLLLAVVLLSGTCIIGVSGISIVWYFLQHRETLEAQPVLDRALAALDAGQYDEARECISQLPNTEELAATEQGKPLFVMGTVVAHEAALCGREAESRALYLVAARYLEEARDRGLPEGHETQGLTLLGQCLFHSGRYAESLPALREAAKADTPDKFELCRLLTAAYLRDTVPNLKAALQFSRLALEDPGLSARQREEALVEQSQIQLQLGDTRACRQTLSSIPPDSPVRDQALLKEARCLIWEGDQLRALARGEVGAGQESSAEKYRQAVGWLEQAQTLDRRGVTTRQAQYLIAVCQRRLGDVSTALEALVRLGRQHYGTDEALAAQLNEAEIRQSRGEHEEARNLYAKVIHEAADAAVYANPWVSLADLRARLFSAHQQFQQANQFAAALALSDACQQILPADERAEMEAHTHKAWGEFLMRDVAGRGSLSGQVTEAEARVHFRAAADAYQRLTSLRYTTHNYTDDLWKSGECFLRGQNYEAAIPLFRQFLQHAPRALHPQGLVGLGECHLALGHYHEALQVLELCIQSYPKHPESYQARLLASHACLQLQQLAETNRPLLQKAKQLLMDNLQNSELTPRSIQWQYSLFAYGSLLFKEAMTQEALSRINGVDSADLAQRKEGLKNLCEANTLFLQAVRHLEEAVQRYPDAVEAGAASYCIAEAYRHAAKLPGKSLLIEATLSRRAELAQQRRELLESAADVHLRLQTRLQEKQRQQELTAVERAILRNTYFAYADIVFDLEDYEQAIKAYLAAANRDPQDPHSLDALVQLASCYRRLNAPNEARGTLLQAKAVLARMQRDMKFEQTTRYNRENWNELIGWLAQL